MINKKKISELTNKVQCVFCKEIKCPVKNAKDHIIERSVKEQGLKFVTRCPKDKRKTEGMYHI